MISVLRHGLSIAAGVAVGSVVVFGATSLGGDAPVTQHVPSPAPEPPPYERTERPDDSELLLAWAPTGTGGLPDDAPDLLEKVRGVRDVTIVSASLDWMSASWGPGGGQIDDPPDGMKIPIEIAAVDAPAYQRFVPPSDRAAIANLHPGEALLSETSAEIRSYVPGMKVKLDGARYSVSGVISDAAASGYEMVVAGGAPTHWEIVDRFALIHVKAGRTRARVTKTLNGTLSAGQVLRIRAKGETPYLRYGDAVMPQSIIKESFGEFAARPGPDGTVVIDPRWTERNIQNARVPILGEVSCHRALVPQLTEALREVRRRSLSFLIDTSQFGGCFGPRFIGRVPGGRLSHHAWGIAIDINALDNAFGTRSDLDPRLIEIMERAGFTWGGRWLVPDGMHFEWVRFP